MFKPLRIRELTTSITEKLPSLRVALGARPAQLDLLDAAVALKDLRVPPCNHPAALKGDRAGQHSIRINDRYRIGFRWLETDADEVEIVFRLQAYGKLRGRYHDVPN